MFEVYTSGCRPWPQRRVRIIRTACLRSAHAAGWFVLTDVRADAAGVAFVIDPVVCASPSFALTCVHAVIGLITLGLVPGCCSAVWPASVIWAVIELWRKSHWGRAPHFGYRGHAGRLDREALNEDKGGPR